VRRLTIISVAFPFAVVGGDPVGGAEQVLSQVDRALVQNGHRSIVIAAEGSRPAGELIGIPQPRGPIGPVEWSRTHEFLRRTLAQVLTSTPADLLHMHGSDFQSYLPPAGIPVLATLHMPFSSYARGVLEPQRPRTWINTVSRHQKIANQNSAAFVGAIENGIAAAPGPPVRRTRSFALALGRICPEKGFHLAIEGAKAAGVAFALAGRAFAYPEHQSYLEHQIKPRLDRARRWIGPVSGARKWRLLRSARCLLAPSLVEETSSLVAREALAAGTPVIAYPKGALADIIEPGRTGFLVHDVEEMARAILRSRDLNPEDCRRVARERYSADRMTREYLELYRRLIEAA
jgi:glycosyltransferase involved in cell wall biosynthesis